VKIHGACHCGAVAYEAQIDSVRVTVCHCRDCQSFSGAPFRASVPAKTEDLNILRGLPKVYVKTAENGNRRAQGFCGDCGSAIYSADAQDAKVYMLRLGAVAERDQLPPQRQIWCEAALDWSRDLLDLPKIEKQS
jgi:hypothetical protein